MTEDSIIAEIRKHRAEHAASYDYDLKKIATALREREHKSNRPVLNPGPKYIRKNE